MTKWEPNYTELLAERSRRIYAMREDDNLIVGAKEFYENEPVEFIKDWCVTFDPRNSQSDLPTLLPFTLFQKQEDFVHFIYDCIKDRENGLVEKCRDMGATWLAVSISLHLWLFHPGSAVGFGSRKEALVDKLGDPDSIFEKLRLGLRYIPDFFYPRGFFWKRHSAYMRLINPENGSIITGEAGDNIGRGGRSLIYWKDESAHYDRPEKIEAALADNTNVQIDISSVNGPTNIFARRRRAGVEWKKGGEVEKGKTRVFIFDWRDHPLKTQAWYDTRKARAQREGLLNIFAQEVDRDYSSAVEGVVIKSEWINAAKDAHLKLNFDDEGMSISALDVADEGGDKNAYVNRKGVILRRCKAWGEGAGNYTAKQAILLMREDGAYNLQYDSVSVGAGVKSSINLLAKTQDLKAFTFVGWNGGSKVLFAEKRIIKGDKGSPKNKDFYSNLKAQGWWQLRMRFEKTYNAIMHGDAYDSSELISISTRIEELNVLERELNQVTYSTNGKGQIVIDKNPPGTKSPNCADAVMMDYWPLRSKGVMI